MDYGVRIVSSNAGDFLGCRFSYNLFVFKRSENAASSYAEPPGTPCECWAFSHCDLKHHFIRICSIDLFEEVHELRCDFRIDLDDADPISMGIPEEFHVEHCVVVADAAEESCGDIFHTCLDRFRQARWIDPAVEGQGT